MSARCRHLVRRMVLTAVASVCMAAAATAQEDRQGTLARTSLADLAARVPVGQVVHVTDASGPTTKGRLAGATDEGVQIRVGTTVRTFAAADIRRIDWARRDSPLDGILLGAGIGAIPGIYWLIADPNECTGLCPEEYVLVAAGAAIGGLIDRAFSKRITVYTAAAPGGRANTLTIRPFASRGRGGVQVAVRF